MGCTRREENTYLVDVVEERALGAVVLEDRLGELLKAGQLVLSLADNPLQGTQLGLGGALVQQVDVDVVGEGELARINSLEERRLSATVLAQQAVAAAVVDLEGGVVEEDLAVEHQRRRDDLDIARLLERGEHAGCDTVGETMLVLLEGEVLDLLVELEILDSVAVHRRGGGGILGVGLGRELRRGRLLGLRVGVRGALGVTGGFGGGDHGVVWGGRGWSGEESEEIFGAGSTSGLTPLSPLLSIVGRCASQDAGAQVDTRNWKRVEWRES